MGVQVLAHSGKERSRSGGIGLLPEAVRQVPFLMGIKVLW